MATSEQFNEMMALMKKQMTCIEALQAENASLRQQNAQPSQNEAKLKIGLNRNRTDGNVIAYYVL